MSYLTFPRLHFSGQFKAYPATINNMPTNYDPAIYPNIEDVQLVWAPKGTGEITLVGCTVTMIEYEDGTTVTTAAEDPIIGQPIFSVPNPHFIAGALVDLDPDQQMVSEIWGMKIQIGGNNAYMRGTFEPAAFNSMFGNVQGPKAPHSSASASVTYQSVLTNLQTEGLDGKSKFLNHFAKNPTSQLSINFMIEAHNNNPVLYSFNDTTFATLKAEGVSEVILAKIKPMQNLKQQNNVKMFPLGDIPTEDFVKYQLQQYLTVEEYNSAIDAILEYTQVIDYKPTTPYDFAHGFICGTVGSSNSKAPRYFVPSRMLATYNNQPIVNKHRSPYFQLVNFAPFGVEADGMTISINLSNSLPVENPGIEFWQERIGALRLVYFDKGDIDLASAVKIADIPYTDSGFLNVQGGMFTTKADIDISKIPLGIVSTMPDGSDVILLAENKDGYYMRANQYVFRMNPGVTSTEEEPRGETARLDIHVLKFGDAAPDGTQISLTANPPQCSSIPGMQTGFPVDALSIQPTNGLAETVDGVATFILSASDPGNPRQYIDGQIYFLSYSFTDPEILCKYVQDSSDFVSIQIYNQQADEVEAIEILNKYGYLYPIMGFLTNDKSVEGIDLRNMIKLLLEKPMSDIRHMPVTRDLSVANRQKVLDWINELNNS